MGPRRLQVRSVATLPGLETTPVLPLQEALEKADLVILAVPCAGFPVLVHNYGHLLCGKVVIDVTNPWGTDLESLGAQLCGLNPIHGSAVPLSPTLNPASSSSSSSSSGNLDEEAAAGGCGPTSRGSGSSSSRADAPRPEGSSTQGSKALTRNDTAFSKDDGQMASTHGGLLNRSDSAAAAAAAAAAAQSPFADTSRVNSYGWAAFRSSSSSGGGGGASKALGVRRSFKRSDTMSTEVSLSDLRQAESQPWWHGLKCMSAAAGGKEGAPHGAPVSASAAEWLAAALPDALVVKSFCNLSAYALHHSDPLTEPLKSVAASDDLGAAEAAAAFGRAMGVEMYVVHSLAYAATLEARQHPLLPAWQLPLLALLGIWLLATAYIVLREVVFGGTAWQQLPLWVTNKAAGWVALWGLVAVYLPGVMIICWQVVLRRPAVRLPGWLKSWMDARKQLGLLSLLAGLLHLVFSALLRTPAYHKQSYDTSIIHHRVHRLGATHQLSAATGGGSGSSTVSTSLTSNPVQMRPTAMWAAVDVPGKLTGISEAATLTGVLSVMLMALIGLASMPSITPKLNWKSWRLLQSKGGWSALALATVHVLLLGSKWWPTVAEWPAKIPPSNMVAAVPAMLLLLLKLLLVVPPLCWLWGRLRTGPWSLKPKTKVGDDPMANVAAFAVVCHK